MFDFLIVSFVFPAGERARTDSKIEDESVVHARQHVHALSTTSAGRTTKILKVLFY